MFNWLRNRRRNIFTFWDGTRRRSIDPAVAWRVMWEQTDCDPTRDFGPATGIGSDGEDVPFDPAAQDRVLAMARLMFGLQPYSDSQPGLTVQETFGVLWDFLRYMDVLKKKRAPSPTPSRHTASASSEMEASTTRPASDSSSTSNEPSPAEPSSSCKRSYQL